MNMNHRMRDTVTIASEADYTGGAPTFSAQVEIKARVEHQTKLVTGTDNNEMESNHQFATETEVKQTDRVWLPGDDTNDNDAARRPILAKLADTLDGGYEMYEVYL